MPDEIVGLPIVDVSGLSSSDLDKRKQVGAELRKACLQYGFFYCAGHGIPQGFIEGVFEESQKFFALPQAEKKPSIRSIHFAIVGINHCKARPFKKVQSPI